MSGEAALAAEELARFLQNLRHVEAACAKLRELDAIEAEIARKNREHDDLLAGMRKQAETEARQNVQAENEAKSAEATRNLEITNLHCRELIADAESKAAEIISAARKRAEQLERQAAVAQEAVRKAFQ